MWLDLNSLVFYYLIFHDYEIGKELYTMLDVVNIGRGPNRQCGWRSCKLNMVMVTIDGCDLQIYECSVMRRFNMWHFVGHGGFGLLNMVGFCWLE